MIHEVHTMRTLMGEVRAVQAMAANAVRGFEVEDTVVINLEFVSGALGSFVLSDTAASPKSWEQTAQENKSYPSYADEDCYHLMGTLGSLSVPSMKLKTYSTTNAERGWWTAFDESVVSLTRTDPILAQMQHFIAVVTKQAEPLVTLADGLANVRVTEAIAQAVQSRTAVLLA
jgi:predicted dehydrogenase